jgi:hypothetical protein
VAVAVELWQFIEDGKGRGVWPRVSVSDPEFSNLFRQVSGSGTTIGDMAYYLGGLTSQRTDPSKQGSDMLMPGIASSNITSGAWSNDSSVGLNTAGMIRSSEVVTIPAFGLDGRGLLIILGGRDPG